VAGSTNGNSIFSAFQRTFTAAAITGGEFIEERLGLADQVVLSRSWRPLGKAIELGVRDGVAFWIDRRHAGEDRVKGRGRKPVAEIVEEAAASALLTDAWGCVWSATWAAVSAW
jgi:hypothetical protein